MRFIGNLLWFILIGLWTGIIWWLIGLLWCITIVGIPVGLQCFKLSKLVFMPFGKDIIFGSRTSSLVLNVLWLIFGGIELALSYVTAGVALCCTIIGIPFGLQCFKLMKLSLLPFGAEIVKK